MSAEADSDVLGGGADGPLGGPTGPETKPASPRMGLSTSCEHGVTGETSGELSLGPSWEGRHTDPDPPNPGERHPSPRLLTLAEGSRILGNSCFSRSRRGSLGEFPKVGTEPDRSLDGEPTLTGESGILETEHCPYIMFAWKKPWKELNVPLLRP